MIMKKSLLNKYVQLFSQVLSNQQVKRLLDRLERISCNIAPLNTSTGNTQTVNRWSLNENDPHFASQDQCQVIFVALIEDLLSFLQIHKGSIRGLLPYFSNTKIAKEDLIKILGTSTRIGNLELPIWYKTPLEEGGKHIESNIFWFSPYKELEQIRNLVGDRLIITKIQVKSYLTDRRQTGDYQTNREVRWETHPKSPQYASRGDCMLIEAKLLYR